MEYDSVIKKNEILPFAATWMQVEIIILSEVRQKKTHIPYVKPKTSHVPYVKPKIWQTWTYLRKRNKLTDMKDRLVVAKEEGGEGLGVWD